MKKARRFREGRGRGPAAAPLVVILALAEVYVLLVKQKLDTPKLTRIFVLRAVRWD